MKILVIGDINGRSGREAVAQHLPKLREEHQLDFVIANADNVSHLHGATPATVKELYSYGIDLLTGGDHIWDQKDMLTHLDREPWVLRPLNHAMGTPGKGIHVATTPKGQKLLVLHAMGRVFTGKLVDDPFAALDKALQSYNLGKNIDAIIVDFHAEATSEKNGMGFHLDGRVSAVLGTHTHVPTYDARVLPQGTAYMTDLGMTGDYNSVIGAEVNGPLHYFRTGLRHDRYKPAEGPGTLCGAIVTTDDKTGLAQNIEIIRMGGVFA